MMAALRMGGTAASGPPADRKDRNAARLAVDVGFCTSRDIETALRRTRTDGPPGPKVGLAYQLLRTSKISAPQYRLLNAGIRHELEREDDLEFASFLVQNHLIKQSQADELIEQQTPYYREGKSFPRLESLLRKSKLLEPAEIQRAWKGLRDRRTAPGHSAPAAAVPAPVPAEPKTSKPTVRATSLHADRCKVSVRSNRTESADGTPCDVHVISLQGQIDAHNAQAVDEFLQGMVSRHQIHLVADMSELKFISSAGLGSLVATLRLVREKGGDLRFAVVPTAIQSVMELLGIDRGIKTFASSEGAVNSFKMKYR